MAKKKKPTANWVVYEHGEVVYGCDTLAACNRWLKAYIKDTAGLKFGTPEYAEHETKYYTVTQAACGECRSKSPMVRNYWDGHQDLLMCPKCAKAAGMTPPTK